MFGFFHPNLPTSFAYMSLVDVYIFLYGINLKSDFRQFYRRLLQMGIHTAEIFNNIALCCLNTQQFDLIIPCIEKALTLANDNILADVWYNLGSVALAANNLELSALCWRLALFYSPNHSEASNNLGVLAMIAGNTEEGKILFNVIIHFCYMLL